MVWVVGCACARPALGPESGAERRKKGWMLLIAGGEVADIPPPRVFCKKRLQTTENKGRELAKEGKEAASFCKQKTWHVCRSERLNVGNDGGYTPVAAGSMRRLLRTGEILAPRGADDGVSCLVRAAKRVGSEYWAVRKVSKQC